MYFPLRRPLLLVIASTALLAGCWRDIRAMRYRDFRAMSEEQRMELTDQLTDIQLRDLTTVTSSTSIPVSVLDTATIGELIQRGEQIRARIEPTPPSR